MTQKQRYQTRLDPDDAAAVDDFADERDIGESEALRRLIRAGLKTAGPVTVARNTFGPYLATALAFVTGLLVGMAV